jgi:intracellular multiplication protein IcmT
MPVVVDTAHWRDSARNPRFFIVEAYAALPILFFSLHMTWWTFYLAMSVTVFFGILEHFKFTLPVFLRWFRAFLAGPLRIAKPWWRT